MLKINRKHPKQPMNGWSYLDNETNIKIKADTVDELIEKVKGYRNANLIKVGNPESDIAEQHSVRYPHLIENVDSVFLVDSKRHSVFYNWLHKAWSNPPALIYDKLEVSRREEICGKCPKNEEIDLVSEYISRLMVISKSTDVSKLGVCSVHGWHNLVGCRMEKTNPLVNQDKSCWCGKSK